jgi:antitoxin (DNA-binding transcriptional repressor) of toxin-antitoxin stability system
MTITVTKQEFRERLEELLTLAQGGAELIIGDENQTPLRVTATALNNEPRIFNMHPGAFVMSDNFDEPIDEDAFLRGDF